MRRFTGDLEPWERQGVENVAAGEQPGSVRDVVALLAAERVAVCAARSTGSVGPPADAGDVGAQPSRCGGAPGTMEQRLYALFSQ